MHSNGVELVQYDAIAIRFDASDSLSLYGRFGEGNLTIVTTPKEGGLIYHHIKEVHGWDPLEGFPYIYEQTRIHTVPFDRGMERK